MKLTKTYLLQLITECINEESEAAKEAHKKNLTSAGWGHWKDNSGKVVAKTKDGKLVKADDTSHAEAKKSGTDKPSVKKPKTKEKTAMINGKEMTEKEFKKLPEEERKKIVVNLRTDDILKDKKPEDYFKGANYDNTMYGWLKDNQDKLTPENKKKLDDYDNGVKKHFNKLIKGSKVLTKIAQMANKPNANEYIRTQLSKNGTDFHNHEYTTMYQLISNNFTGKDEGWFGGLSNFIDYVKSNKTKK